MGVGTARVESATWRWIDRAGDLAAENITGPPAGRVWNGHRSDKTLSVGVE
jgi:hypothetical protein